MALRPHVAQELLNKVTKALGITALDQWYYVSHHAASKVIGSRALNKFGGTLSSFLKHAYPQHYFDEEKLTSRNSKEKDQKFIEIIVRKLFPNEEIHTKARKVVGITNPETGAYLEIDFWIPRLKLGIEYQDKHHYGYQWYANEALANYQKRDKIKKDTMSHLGYTLITIGYWWDKTIESVAATIRKHRPDLLQGYKHISAVPIPLDPPLGITNESPVIPGVAGLMSPFVPGYKFNPTHWYGGEKYDGIRGVYNPKLEKMFSRSGNELSILSWLLKDIPNILVEGEVIAGRGNYNKTTAVSFHTHHDKVNWPIFRYVVYDIPDMEAGNYTRRYTKITRRFFEKPFVFAQSTFRVLLNSKSHLKMLVDAIISDGGEGVIAQQDSRYEFGRAKGLAKIKVRRDADAQVLRINEHSCTCQLASGITAEITFGAGFDPITLQTADIISYYHDGYSQSGLPKRGEIYKVRYDVTWENLLGDKWNSAKRRLVKEAIGSKSLLTHKSGRNKIGHWNKPANVRAYFDGFAKTSGFDPHVAENWYPVKVSTLHNTGGGGLLGAYNYNVKKALSLAYPELKLDKEKFLTYQKPRGYWHKPTNVREFFDEFALIQGFEPLVPENWYPLRHSTLRSAGGSGVLTAHRGDIKKALSCAYPELKFEIEDFEMHAIRGRWNKLSNVRAFFDEFAQTSGFDPLVADNWNAVRPSSLQIAKGSGLLGAYDNNIKKALAFAYPELELENG